MNPIPFVTVIMPIRNEAAYIARSLGSILAQDHPAERLQILIVDGMSTDGTREMIHHIMRDMRKNGSAPTPALLLLDNPQGIVPTALNIGLGYAAGDIIVRVDGHCEIPPYYLSYCVETLQCKEIDCVGGPITTIGETPMAETIAVAMSSGFGVGGAAFRTVRHQTQLVDTIAFGAYKRAAIERCGYFDEELVRNQDDEYNYRLRKLGGRILLSSAIQAKYYSRGTLRKLWSQYYQYGYWKVRVLQKHPAQMQWRQFVPPLFVAALLGGALLALFNNLLAILWSTMLVFYVLANLAATAWTAAHQEWRHLLLLPVVYATLHISYGLGFLVGLIRFAHRWRAGGQSVAPVQSS